MAKTTFKSNTAKGRNYISTYNQNIGFRLQDVYGSYSQAKENAWNWCFEKYLNQKENNSRNFHICSANTFSFTVAWETDTTYQIETSCNSYTVLK